MRPAHWNKEIQSPCRNLVAYVGNIDPTALGSGATAHHNETMLVDPRLQHTLESVDPVGESSYRQPENQSDKGTLHNTGDEANWGKYPENNHPSKSDRTA